MGNPQSRRPSSLRHKILLFVGALVVLSLAGSTVSLYRITEVNGSLHAINRVSVPLGRLLTQLNSDAEVYKREANRRIGSAHWSDVHWRPKPIPSWIEEVIENEMTRAASLIAEDLPWAPRESRADWSRWITELRQEFHSLRQDTAALQKALDQNDSAKASEIYPRWSARMEEWSRKASWGATEQERTLRQNFSIAQSRVSGLRAALEFILILVISLSLLFLWLGERALRPLAELTTLVREITRRGLRREDKTLLPMPPISRNDEVSALAREFHHMATALLEREKTVELQKDRLQESNRQLREMGALNENILNSIKSVLIVADTDGIITQCNPLAAQFLGGRPEEILGTPLGSWKVLGSFADQGSWLARTWRTARACKIEPSRVGERVYGGHLFPLRREGEAPHGAIIALEDLTEELEFQERLTRAENLAAVGRMSAQVAHEVRNPLHSIGLEAEMAFELAVKTAQPQLKLSLQSILAAVDRLEKITENYLKLSRLSAGRKDQVDLGDVLESVLATYASACQAQGVRVEWSREAGARLLFWGDRDLLEQALGNLLRNSLQALESARTESPMVSFRLGNAESGRVWLRIEDNGPGVAAAVREKLFTPFVTTRAQGTGLGLSFVRRVIEEHGGSIQCGEPAYGACFDLYLPLSLAASLNDETTREESAEDAQI